MNDMNVHVACVDLVLKPVADETGLVGWYPEAEIAAWQAAGLERVPIRLVVPPQKTDSAPWLRLCEAAKLHLDDVDGISYDTARIAIRRATLNGQIKATGCSQRLRIEPTSFAAWRLKRREENLNKID